MSRRAQAQVENATLQCIILSAISVRMTLDLQHPQTRSARLAITNPWVQAALLGMALFAISLLIRATANTLVGSISAGPAAPNELFEARDPLSRFYGDFILAVMLPALAETPVVVWLVRRANSDAPSVGLAITILFIFALAWLLHGMSPGSLGQGAAFALMAYAAWAWGRRLGRLHAYALPMLSHAVWNGIGMAIATLRHAG